MATLAEALAGVRSWMVSELEANTGIGQMLEGFTIVDGRKSRPLPEMPALWVYATIGDPIEGTRTLALQEEWAFRYTMEAVTSDLPGMPADVYAYVETAASNARMIVLKQRKDTGLGYVLDMASGEFTAAGEGPGSGRNRTIYGSAAEVQARFLIDEQLP